MKLQKYGQMQIAFNWIFVLIAGVIILAFFAGIVVKQQQASEVSLSISIVSTLDSIFTAAQVSDKTTNSIPVGALSKYVLEFDCNEGVSEFSIQNQAFRETNTIDPIFAPLELQGTHYLLMSLPYNFPYKSNNFLMLSSPNIMYVIIGKTNTDFTEEFLNQTKGFNTKYLPNGNLENVEVGENIHIQIVDVDGGNIVKGTPVPDNFDVLEDSQITAVSFSGSRITHYSRQLGVWQSNGETPLLSLHETRDAAKFAAIFAGNSRVYWCNMKKALKRAELLDEIYLKKADEMISYYNDKSQFLCKSQAEDVRSALEEHKSYITVCEPKTCEGLNKKSLELQELNEKLRTESCTVQLY